MNILIVSVFFPPQNAIASLRPYSWAKWWTRMGHNVTILTETKYSHENDLKLDCSFLSIIDVPLRIPFRNNKNIQTEKSETISSKRNTFKNNCLALLKSIYTKFRDKTGCFLTCRYPDWHDKWIKEAVKKLPKIDWDLVVTTGGPYSVHYAGLYLKKSGWNGKWICDWRDLWTRNHIYHGLLFFHPLEKYLERKIHKKADYITTVSDELANTLRLLTKTPVETIYNGFDTEDFNFLFKNERKINSKYTISYLGSIYKGFRDPEPLFQAISELYNNGIITPNDLVIQFAGDKTANVKDLVNKYEIDSFYKYLGFLSREKSLELQYNSDAVLFLEYDNPKVKGVLTGKLFEYLYVSRFILGIGCSYNTSAGMLIKETNSGVCLGKDIELIKEFLLEQLNNRESLKNMHLKKSYEKIEKYNRKIQAQKLLSLIEKK